jgi:DNA-binding NarL/FixJ family response regulator
MKKARVILVDDYEVVLKGLAAIVNNDRFEVVATAGDGVQAIKTIQKVTPDIAVLDIGMPGLNGIEVAHQVRAFDKRIKLLIMSGYSNTEYIRRALLAGVDGFILKSSASDVLLYALDAVLEGRQYFAEEIQHEIDMFKLGNASLPNPLDALTGREREVFFFMLEGKTIKETAEALSLSTKTVETYRSRVMAKFGVSNITMLIKYAISKGLAPVD